MTSAALGRQTSTKYRPTTEMSEAAGHMQISLNKNGNKFPILELFVKKICNAICGIFKNDMFSMFV